MARNEDKERKAFKETKLYAFLEKAKDAAIDKGPELAGAVALAATGNPVAAIGKAVSALTSSDQPGTDELAAELSDQKDAFVTEFELHIRNTEGARKMYETSNVQADKIADNVFFWNPIFIGALMVLNILIVIVQGAVEMNGALISAITIVSNLITFVVKQFLDERITVVNFYFGSSIGSKQKSEELNKAFTDGTTVK